MRLTILGSGTSIPDRRRASPGLVLELEDAVVLVDPSSGSLHRMERHGISSASVTHVLISHFHPDHTGDLVPLLFCRRNRSYFPSGRPLRLMGPPGLAGLMAQLSGVYGDWIDLGPDLEVAELDGAHPVIGGWTLAGLRVQHTESSLGYRFSRGAKVFAYSGDTQECPGLQELLKAADVAVIESSHLEPKVGHLTPSSAGRAASQAGCKRIVLTHLYPETAGVALLARVRQAGFAGEVDVGFDGMRLEL